MTDEDMVVSEIQHAIGREFRKTYGAKIAVYNCETMLVSLVYDDGRTEHYQLQYPNVTAGSNPLDDRSFVIDFSAIANITRH